ncbi:unnamed protein product, partial [Urochloa humidicola]
LPTCSSPAPQFVHLSVAARLCPRGSPHPPAHRRGAQPLAFLPRRLLLAFLPRRLLLLPASSLLFGCRISVFFTQGECYHYQHDDSNPARESYGLLC